MDKSLNILMAASENGWIPGAKAGGIGDVVRDVPIALAEENHRVTIVLPSYGFLHKEDNGRKSQLIETIIFEFDGESEKADIYEITVDKKPAHPNIKHLVIDHPRFLIIDPNKGKCDYSIYYNDPPDEPFATDALKFSFFCLTLAEAIKQNPKDLFSSIDCLHLHDWHVAYLLILRKYHEHYKDLQAIKRTVFTIHNLAYQGIRPFKNHPSSLELMYPGMTYNTLELADPRWLDSFNPMAAGIRLSDAVHTVSPSYAEEITKASIATETERYFGGEGLEESIRAAKMEGRLFGILNGCEYPTAAPAQPERFPDWIHFLKQMMIRWMAPEKHLPTAHYIAHTRLSEIDTGAKPDIILTSVSRVTEQKMLLLKHTREVAPGVYQSTLQSLLEELGDRGLYILLGTGTEEYEQFFIQMSFEHKNFIFLCGYSDGYAASLYENGDLFIMPSSFEPCGISQMIAMRAGQPCVVHNVGGLKDTVRDKENGFVFEGGGLNLDTQAENFLQKCKEAIDIKSNDPTQWNTIRQNALNARFMWKDSIQQYVEKLYSSPLS